MGKTSSQTMYLIIIIGIYIAVYTMLNSYIKRTRIGTNKNNIEHELNIYITTMWK